MPRYAEMSKAELEAELAEVRARYGEMAARGLKLNMARGKPSAAQLELSLPLLDVLDSAADLAAEDGTDCRNYGVLDGIPEAKRLMATLLDDEPENVIVLGNASLTAMYDAMVRYLVFGALGSTPWGRLPEVKWLCPVPGYDRHFSICEDLGIEMIPVPLCEDGPDMEEVERLVAADDTIKGIWCVPKYSNPQGITYSDETVRRFARMKTAADDFMIMWDNAYAVHDLYPDRRDTLLNILDECKKAGDPDRVMIFASTSKISYAGAGIAVFACSEAVMKRMKELLSFQTIGFDKLNMLRHARYFGDLDGVMRHMDKQAELLRPKFAAVLDAFDRELAGKGIAEWLAPNGGYFISLDVMDGCARRVVRLCKEAGVVLTGAGATYPYKKDPRDRNIRVAPTYPTVPELEQAVELLCISVQLAAVEKLLAA